MPITPFVLTTPSVLGPYLAASEFIDTDDPRVRATHAAITRGAIDVEDAALLIYGFVRDEVRHSMDAGDDIVTLRASEVLATRTGLCYAKSHLAAALMRLSGIPTGLCYQVIPDSAGPVLHGLIAVRVRQSWHRLDVRGLKPGLAGGFSLTAECLPYRADSTPGLRELPELLAEPAPSVVRCLADAPTVRGIILPRSLD